MRSKWLATGRPRRSSSPASTAATYDYRGFTAVEREDLKSGRTARRFRGRHAAHCLGAL